MKTTKKKIQAKKIVERLKAQQSDRQKITLYLSRSLYEDLKKHSDGVAPSQIIEELIKEFLKDLR